MALWNSRLATFIVEGALWFGAIVFYTRGIRATRRIGAYVFWTMIVLLTLLWLVGLRGDPPPSLKALALTNTVFFLVVEAWAYWINRMSVRTTG